MFFFLRNSSPLFSITRSSSFSVIQVSVNTKNNAKKDTTLLLCGRPCDFLPNKTLSCIWVAIPVDWVILHWYACGVDGRSPARWLARCTVTWLPNFLGSVDYYIFLAMGLRAARGAPPWTCQVLFRKKNAIICILARNAWASVSIIYHPSINASMTDFFCTKISDDSFSYMWVKSNLFICMQES